MADHRISIPISSELAAELDALAGSGNRNEFAVTVLEREVRRERLLKVLANREPIWKDEDHPELAEGSEAWVRRLRQEAEARFKRLPELRPQRIEGGCQAASQPGAGSELPAGTLKRAPRH